MRLLPLGEGAGTELQDLCPGFPILVLTDKGITLLTTPNDFIRAGLCHEIHTSERRSFRACRRRWDWHFRQAYYPITTAKPLEFGIAFHRAMEVLYNPDTWTFERKGVVEEAVKAFKAVAERQKREALEIADRYELDTDVEEDYAERVELGEGMIRYYGMEVAPRIDVGWKPVRVEIGFKVPINHPETKEPITCTCELCWAKYQKYIYEKADSPDASTEDKLWAKDLELGIETDYFGRDNWGGLPVVYAGRCDMLAQDENGGLWIFDWKTARSIPDNHEFLFLDDQIGSYCWALRKLGLDIRGFVYHEQRKGYPQPPKQNKFRRLGRLFSVAENQDTDYDTYLNHVKEFDKEAYEEGLYDDFLSFLRNDGITYYHREKVLKTWDELLEIEYNIGQEVLDMIDPSLRIYPSAGRFGCSFCAFQQPCREKNSKGDFQYALDAMFQKSEHYYVRQEASTESKGGE